jgi:Putative adhesin/Domain of unknown function (DUF5668)
MARLRPRSGGVFSGFLLITIGALLLLHNYRGLDLGRIVSHWWPLFLIVWGLVKLYGRTAGSRSGDPGTARVTGGEIFLVVGLLVLVGVVVAVDHTKGWIDRKGIDVNIGDWADAHSFDLEVAPKAVPANARILVRGTRGDITIRAADKLEIRVSGQAKVRSWDDSDAEKIGKQANIEIVQNGDGFEIRPTGAAEGNSRVAVDMDIAVPPKAMVTIRNEKGDINVSDLATPVTINAKHGDITVRDTGGDVSIDASGGDISVSDTKGDVKISGRGGEVSVTSATGGLTLNGEFVGPIRVDKVAKGVRFLSHRTDLTLTQLTGHLETESGNLNIIDAPGDLTLRTNRYDISIENVSGKLKIDNRDGNVSVRFSAPPKADIEITNASAPISLSLPSNSNFEIAADCHSGDIDSEFEAGTLTKTTTKSSDAHLEGKYGASRGPKITLKTSYGSIAITKTT